MTVFACSDFSSHEMGHLPRWRASACPHLYRWHISCCVGNSFDTCCPLVPSCDFEAWEKCWTGNRVCRNNRVTVGQSAELIFSHLSKWLIPALPATKLHMCLHYLMRSFSAYYTTSSPISRTLYSDFMPYNQSARMFMQSKGMPCNCFHIYECIRLSWYMYNI